MSKELTFVIKDDGEYEEILVAENMYVRIFRGPNTLHGKQKAFDDLRKRTTIDCDRCGGWGFTIVYAPNPIWVCLKCRGDACVCAYCNGNSETCECGGDDA